MKQLFINFRKAKNVVSNLTFNEHKMYEAHTASQPGYESYVDIDSFNKLKITLMRIATGDMNSNDSAALAKSTLKDVLSGEFRS